MYVVTEYQYQQLRNYCKDAVVDEIGRQPLNEESQTTAVQQLQAKIVAACERALFHITKPNADNPHLVLGKLLQQLLAIGRTSGIAGTLVKTPVAPERIIGGNMSVNDDGCECDYCGHQGEPTCRAVIAASKIKESAPSASTNTGMDAIPLWAVRTWLRRNVDSNLAIVETKIVEMVCIAMPHKSKGKRSGGVASKCGTANNERDEICAKIIESKDPCDYCKVRNTNECHHRENYICFVGRKLSPVL